MKIRAPHEVMEEEKEQELPQFAGGVILPDDFKLDNPFTVDGGASSTIKSPLVPPQTAAAPVVPQPMAPKPAPVATPAPAPQPRALPGMPPSVTPEALKSYLDQKRSSIDKYSADDQYALEKRNTDNRRGLGYNLASSAATFADGIMQGVARAGNPGFAKALDDRTASLGADEAAAFERARENTGKEIDAKSKLDYQDPSSPMSQMYQEAFGPIFQKMGYAPDSVMRMPASQIANIATLGIQYEDAQSQQELKRAMLGLQGITANANIVNQQEQRKAEKEKSRMDAAEGLQKRPWYQKLAEAPFVPLPKSEATKEMERQLQENSGGHVYDTEEEAAAAGLPDGTPVTIGGVEGTWRT